jgi:drug/metabolite transporter (DMT)-like permease
VLGLLSAAAWGTGDFIAKRAVDRIGPYQTLFYMFLVGTAVLGVLTFFTLNRIQMIDPTLFLLTVISSLLCVLGYFFLYYGFQIGSLSVVSTITAGGTIVPVLFSLLFLKEWPTVPQFAGIGLIICGVGLVSFRGKPSPLSQKKILGVFPAILSSLFFGSYVILVKLVSEKTGPVLPIFIVRGVGVILMGSLLLYRKETIYPPRPVWKYLFAIGLLDALAFLSFTVGIHKALVSIVSPLSSLFTLVTVSLARLILKEKLVSYQIYGFWSVLFGVLALSF